MKTHWIVAICHTLREVLRVQKLITFTCLAQAAHSPKGDINVQSCYYDTVLSYVQNQNVLAIGMYRRGNQI